MTLNKTKDKKEVQLNLPFEIDSQSTIENFGKLLSADKKVMKLEGKERTKKKTKKPSLNKLQGQDHYLRLSRMRYF